MGLFNFFFNLLVTGKPDADAFFELTRGLGLDRT